MSSERLASSESGAWHGPLSSFEQLRMAREILQRESAAIALLVKSLDDRFCEAVSLVASCRGSLLVSGMGKAGLIGQKLMATFASTGTRSHFVHPGEAIHGDLGRIASGDVLLMLSQSGETDEVTRILPAVQSFGVPIIAITARSSSTLGRAANVVLEIGKLEEACHLGVAPSTSTTVMLALGDALALTVSRQRGFRLEDFARFHPGGSLGRKLSRVEEIMRPLAQCRVANEAHTIRTVLAEAKRPGRRTGATMLVDAEGRLAGIFTDSDLARLFEQRREHALDEPIAAVMTRSPTTVTIGALLREAVSLLSGKKISELPVVAEDGRPVGLIDITDVAALLPERALEDNGDHGGAPRIALYFEPTPASDRNQ